MTVKKKKKLNPLIISFSLHGNGDTIRIGREIQYLPYVGFLHHICCKLLVARESLSSSAKYPCLIYPLTPCSRELCEGDPTGKSLTRKETNAEVKHKKSLAFTICRSGQSQGVLYKHLPLFFDYIF